MRTSLLLVLAACGCSLEPLPGPSRPAKDDAPVVELDSLTSTTAAAARGESWIALAAPAGSEGCRAFWSEEHLFLWSGDAPCLAHRLERASESWMAMSTDGSPPLSTWYAGTAAHRLVVYGYDGEAHRAASYDPESEAWMDTAPLRMGAAPEHVRPVSAGDTLLLWGGYDPGYIAPRFVRYDAEGNTWWHMSESLMPAPRWGHAAIWDTHHMFVFGGRDYQGALRADAGLYDVPSDGWESLSALGAPTPRMEPAIAWTGFVYVVFGGSDDTREFLGDGGIYCPAPCWAWQPMSPPEDGFVPRHPRAFWTGEHVVVVATTDTPMEARRYFPDDDVWQRIDTPAALHDFVIVDVHWDWKEHRALLWGHHGDGSFALWIYNPPYATDPRQGHPGDNLAGNQTQP